MINVDELTDEEVRQELIVRGHSVGPVVESTRNVYINKLRRIIEQESKNSGAMQPVESLAEANICEAAENHEQTSSAPDLPTAISTEQAYDWFENQTPSFISKGITTNTESKIPVANVIKTPEVIIHPSSPKPLKSNSTSSRTTFESSFLPAHNSLTSDISSSKPRGISQKSHAVQTSPNERIRSHVKVPNAYKYIANKRTSSKNVTHTSRKALFLNDWEKSKIGDRNDSGSDDDFRGEESSRILSSGRNDDHTTPAMRYKPTESNYAAHYKPSRHISAFENSYAGIKDLDGTRKYRNVNMASTKADAKPRNCAKIFVMLIIFAVLIIFIFFVIQNYAALEKGEGNKEEF